MESLQRQLQFVSQVLSCSATLEHASQNMWICHLEIPWCGRQLYWQVLLPAQLHSAPDLLFDDETFLPLCGPPFRPDYHFQLLEPGQPGRSSNSSQAALRALLRSWSGGSPAATDAAATMAATAVSALPPAPPQLHQQHYGAADSPSCTEASASFGATVNQRLLRLVSVLLEAYREHQLGKLERVAAAVPRLQFELSTLELGMGVQLELQPPQQQPQQVCFALRLPPLNLRRLLELADIYGARLSSWPQPLNADQDNSEQLSPPTALQQQHQQQQQQSSNSPLASASPAVEGRSIGTNLPHDQDHGPRRGPGDNAAMGCAGLQQRPSPPSPSPSQLQLQLQPAGTEFTLLATFRLPVVAGSDLADPDMTLQLPRVLMDLKAQEGGTAVAVGAGGGGGAASATSGSDTVGSGGGTAGVSGPGLVPSFLLPLWSPQMCLAEFVPLAVERLQAQVDTHCHVLATRQQLLHQIGNLLGFPLEVNLAIGCALYAVAWEGSPVLVSVELGSRFPADKPTVVLQCVRVLPGADASRTYRDYPWSPRWAPGEMAARIHSWLQEELPIFTRGRVLA
ncbi:hypothetical protein VaNZ11_014867 [Volvox africanus]|uniref:BRISC and BRCA1-A complex member 2 n=1 Tax=Volvox africanus TaxID=51714 RepID=A0ABQ5SKE8_9CHLO|nr:hypothetical protein VaNZ11_014867 [Volvox africanus]